MRKVEKQLPGDVPKIFCKIHMKTYIQKKLQASDL